MRGKRADYLRKEGEQIQGNVFLSCPWLVNIVAGGPRKPIYMHHGTVPPREDRRWELVLSHLLSFIGHRSCLLLVHSSDVKQIFHAPPREAKAGLGPAYRVLRHCSLCVWSSLVGGRGGRSPLL